MIKWKNLKQVPERPYTAFRKLNRLYHRRWGLRSQNPDGIHWLDQDWDVLTILDACRYDMFKEESNLPGELSAVESVEGATAKVFRKNLDGENLYDTVFVSAHPAVYNGQRDRLVNRDPIRVQFHDQIDVWKDAGWDQNAQTVMPETMEEYILEVAEEYPNKRLLLHFLQPHCPFIGKVGKRHYDTEKRNFWGDVIDGEVDTSHLEKAYRENLNSVLPTVERIMNAVQGKHIVTGDHGQFLGERAWPVPNQEWGHPWGIYNSPVIMVPWLEHINGGRRNITYEDPNDRIDQDVDNDTIRERLGYLGYVN